MFMIVTIITIVWIYTTPLQLDIVMVMIEDEWLTAELGKFKMD